MADLEPHILSNIIDWVHAAFLYSDYTQQMGSLTEETLFGHFVTTLNNAFEAELAQKDEGYESGSESFNIPTTLSRVCRVYHVSTMEELSFDPTHFGQSPATPEHHEGYSPWRCKHCSITHRWLVFTSSDDDSPIRPNGWHCQHSSNNARSPVCRRARLSSPDCHNQHHYHTPTPNTEQLSTDFDNFAWNDGTTRSKENFPTVSLDAPVWSEDPFPDRHLCIHRTPQQTKYQCSYPCPYRNTTFRMDLPQSTLQDAAVFYYELMDFSDVSSDIPDIMMTTSDDNILGLANISDSEHLDNIQHRAWFV